MKKKWLYLLILAFVVLLLAACGAKSEEDVVNELKAKVENMKGYKLNAKMNLAMGSEAQEYDVEVWHDKPDFYRVEMKNAANDQSQMILRNKEGVFVLTPALNKSFKFQSEWPQNTSQPYLYESLVTDILEDDEKQYTETEKHYVFETKTRYQYHKMLPIQEITFNKSDLSPVSVKIMDQDRNVMLAVDFSDAEFNAKFDEGSFDLDRNMTGMLMGMPVTTNETEEAATEGEMTLKLPMAELAGTMLTDEQEVETETGTRYIMTYTGDRSFTFTQERARVMEATSSMMPTYVNGDPVSVGTTIGAMTDRSITWVEDGVEYKIVSNDLTKEEMLMLANSVQVVDNEK